MSNINLKDGKVVPRHSVINRESTQLNGYFIPLRSYLVLSGSTTAPGGSTTVVSASVDSYAFEVKRVEVFHSGAAGSFDFSLENELTTTNPLRVIAGYENIAGSVDFTSGLDHVESLIGLADNGGKLYLKFTPDSSGGNTFKYLIFIEPANVYVNKDLSLQHF